MRVFIAVLLFASVLSAQNPTVRFHTNVGDIDVLLTPDVAPLTVSNFINYVSSGTYINTIIHRSVPGFVIQGGGYQLINHLPVPAATNPAIANEFNVTNSRGTIAMAKTSDPNSATDQWFFNLANNGSSLDSAANGAFTVFGHITNAAGLAVMDKIASFPVYNYDNASLTQVPLNNYKGTLQDGNWVLVTSIVQLPVLTNASYEDAASAVLTNTTGIAPGEFLSIYGTSLGPAQLTTLTVDGNNVVTNSLAGTQVLFDGTPGAMVFTSSGQISVIAPYNLAGKSAVNVAVVYQGVQSGTVQFPVFPANPGLFTTTGNGKGDAAIVRIDGAFITTANPASPGDILELYGEGYGVAAPSLADGAIVGSTLPMPVAGVKLLIDGQPVNTIYAGGAPSLVNGVLQVNFTVPTLNPGSHSIQLQIGDKTSPAGVNLQTR
ncbi:MAG: peptidylprolyl isomerase [Acidobacteriota bacterium]|nr:peptidylprolyl isomerase [Acidobacteriota bacterium]